MNKVCNLVRDVVASTKIFQKYLKSDLSRRGQIALNKFPKIADAKQGKNILGKQTKIILK